jgi:hypothetical protein
MKICTYIFVLLLIFVDAGKSQEKNSIVNFKHLEHLTETIEFQGDSVDIVHIYADYPAYNWTDASNEGVACVDDAARAAIVYLRHYDVTKDRQSIERAKRLLRFVMKMETDDGMFYNFIYKDHSINKEGKTSYKSFGWWGARAVWCMATGYRILKDRDPAFASMLNDHIRLAFPHIDSLMIKYDEIKTIKGYRIPQWLLYESGTDVTSELLLGLIEYHAASHDPKVKQFIQKQAEGLMVMQDGDINTFPFGLHRSWQTMWHMWGNAQTQALAAAGRMLKNKKMIRSAKLEADGFYSRMLIDGFMKELDVTDSSKTMRFEQIAYGVRAMVVGLIRLYEATEKTEYLKMAGLASSWLSGNNVLHQRMYDSATGRCFDGIRDSATVNKNSGAESTIEALFTLVELERYPVAKKYSEYTKVKQVATSDYVYAIFENNVHKELTLGIDLKKSGLFILEGKGSARFRAKIPHN